MKKIKKTAVSIAPPCTAQQVYLLGTYNPDGTLLLQSQAFVCYIPGPPEGRIIAIATSDQMKENILRDQVFSLNLCNVDMLPIVEIAWEGHVPNIDNEKMVEFTNGIKLNVPILDASPYVEECKIIKTLQIGDTLVVIAETMCVQADNNLILPYSDSDDLYEWYIKQDAQKYNPLMYSVKYYTLSNFIDVLNKNNW